MIVNVTNNNLSLLQNDLLLKQKKLQQKQGERFLQFALKEEINGLIPLIDLQGTIEIALADILPVPQVAEYWLGIANWQGEAIWILDLAQLLGVQNWHQKSPIATSGMAMLSKIENQTIGLLVEEVKGIETYKLQDCLPVAEVNSVAKMKSLFKGYFLNPDGEPSMLLNLSGLVRILQN